jgi:3-oxoadipate enol-lactonase
VNAWSHSSISQDTPMPLIRVSPDLEMFYRLDDFTDPWKDSEVVMLLHGVAENGEVWFGWVPHLGRRFRVLRPDMRGFGQSTPMAADFRWSLDRIVEDYVSLLSKLNIARVHLVGAKLGGMIALHFAAIHPELVKTLTVLGGPTSGKQVPTATSPGIVHEFEEHGVEAWSWISMDKRLGSAMPRSAKEWMAKTMGGTAVSTLTGCFRDDVGFDVSHELERISSPTLIVTTTASGLGSVEQVRASQKKIANSELEVVQGDSFHVAFAEADKCADRTLQFIERHV